MDVVAQKGNKIATKLTLGETKVETNTYSIGYFSLMM